MNDDFLYENPPLVEVIAEVRWNVVRLESVQTPNAGVDPLFARASQKFTDAVGKIGFSHVERLIPAEVPIELIANHPIFRYRRQAEKWPLFQIGPGLFSCNITLPYDGWKEFRRVIQSGLEVLDRSFQFSNELFDPSLVQLRYVNAFTAKHGMVRFAEFCTNDLSLKVALPAAVMNTIDDPGQLTFTVEYEYAVKDLEVSRMGIKCAEGQANNLPAALLQLSMTQKDDLGFAKSAEGILAWMDPAHTSLRGTFQQMASPRLRGVMGPTKPIGRRQ